MGDSAGEARDEIDALVPGWEEQGLSSSLIATLELSKRIMRIGGIIDQAVRAELAELGLTYAEFDVLAALFRVREPYRLKPSELTRTLFLTSGGTSNVLQRLTTTKYIVREADPGDARSHWVRLTPEGLALATKALETTGHVHTEVTAAIPDEAIRHAADALRQILLPLTRPHRP